MSTHPSPSPATFGPAGSGAAGRLIVVHDTKTGPYIARADDHVNIPTDVLAAFKDNARWAIQKSGEQVGRKHLIVGRKDWRGGRVVYRLTGFRADTKTYILERVA